MSGLLKLKATAARLRDPNSFLNHFSYSFLANIITIASQLLFTPIITRYYSPASYGIFTSIFAFAANISLLLTLRYEYAILIERSRTSRDVLARLLTVAALAVSLLMALTILANRSAFNHFFGLETTSYWLLSLPVMIFLQVMFQVTGMEITLMKKYRDAFVYGSSAMVASKGLTLGAGIYSGFPAHFGGMIAGDLFLRLVFVIFRVFISLKKKLYKYFFLVRTDINNGIKLFKRYKQFPLYELPSGYISLFVSQSHLYFLTYMKDKTLLGLLGVTFTVLDAPLRLLSYSISPILMQKVGEFKKAGKDFAPFLTRIFIAYYAITTLPLIASQFWATDVFSLVFGNEWERMGIFVSCFLLFYFYRIEVDIYENLLAVSGNNKKKFFTNTLVGISRVLALLVSYLIVKDVEKSIIIWGYVSAVIYFVTSIFYSYILGIRSKWIIFVKFILLVLGFIALRHQYQG